VENKNKPTISLEDLDKAPLSLPKKRTKNYSHEYEERFHQIAQEKFELTTKVYRLEQELATKKILDDMIKPYAARALYFMCAYCFVVMIFLIMHGNSHNQFKLPESVLNFLVGSTAVTVIGLVGMVLTGIFIGARPKH
jgi:hypothetical protein